MKKPRTTNTLDILNRRHPPTGQDLGQRKAFGRQMEVAELIHRGRTDAGLFQRCLAQRVVTTASVICRLEDGDYEGHCLAMLRHIAEALGQCVEVRFVPAKAHAVHA